MASPSSYFGAIFHTYDDQLPVSETSEDVAVTGSDGEGVDRHM